MHDHRSAPWPDGIAPYDADLHEHQRILILELAVGAPADGDHMADLARALELAPSALDAAAEGLVAAGLAELHGDRLYATTATRALDVLWPLALGGRG